jgi:hypothetical protein
MNVEVIDAVLLYPTSACFWRAARRLAACKPYPVRLLLGFRRAFFRSEPYDSRLLHHPAYNPLPEAAWQMNFTIGIHGGSESGRPTLGFGRFIKRFAVRHLART